MKNHKNVRLYVLSNMINRFGDSVDLIAFMWLTYEVTDSVMLTGVVAAFNGIPSILLGLFSGVITDHYNKKKLIVAGDFARGVIVMLIITLFYFKSLNMFSLCAATLLISTFEILSTPARRSLMPFLVEKDQLRKENSKNSTGKTLAQIIGLSIAGSIIHLFGVAAAVMVDAVTFFISALLIHMLQFEDDSEIVNHGYSSIILEIKESLSVVVKKTVILKTTIMAAIVNIFIGGFNVLALSYCENVTGTGSQGQSMLNTLSVFGILTISTLFAHIKRKINLNRAIEIGFFGLGICFLLFGTCSNNIVSYAIAYLYGLATGCITVSSVTILQHDIPLNHMGKVMAVVSLLNESSIPLGNVLVGIMLERFSADMAFSIYGTGIVISMFLLMSMFFYLEKRRIKE